MLNAMELKSLNKNVYFLESRIYDYLSIHPNHFVRFYGRKISNHFRPKKTLIAFTKSIMLHAHVQAILDETHLLYTKELSTAENSGKCLMWFHKLA